MVYKPTGSMAMLRHDIVASSDWAVCRVDWVESAQLSHSFTAKLQGRRKAVAKTRKQRGHRRQEPNPKESKDEKLTKGTNLKLI